MSEIKIHTPIIISVGQDTEPVPQDLAKALSHADLAAKAGARFTRCKGHNVLLVSLRNNENQNGQTKIIK